MKKRKALAVILGIAALAVMLSSCSMITDLLKRAASEATTAAETTTGTAAIPSATDAPVATATEATTTEATTTEATTTEATTTEATTTPEATTTEATPDPELGTLKVRFFCGDSTVYPERATLYGEDRVGTAAELSDGEASVTAPAGRYYLLVEARGFWPERINVTLEKGRELDLGFEELVPEEVGRDFRTGPVVQLGETLYTCDQKSVFALTEDGREELMRGEFYANASVCTNGQTLYVTDVSGTLYEIDLRRGECREVASGLASACHVCGVDRTGIYLTVEDLWENYEPLPGWAECIEIETGRTRGKWEFSECGCGGGYNYVRGRAYDVSAREMTVYDDAGAVVAEMPYCWTVQEVDGVLWYVQAPEMVEGYLCREVTLYAVLSDGPRAFGTWEFPEGEIFAGAGFSGFVLTLNRYEDAITQERIDLRTMKVVDPTKYSGPLQYVEDAFERGGVEYAWDGAALYIWYGDHFAEVLSVPEEYRYARVYVIGETAVFDSYVADPLAIPIPKG